MSRGFDASKLDVIHIGPINGNSNPKPPIETDNNYLRILFLGRMTRVKGVEALARLSHLLNPLKFQISLVGQCSPIIATYIRGISNSNVLTLIDNPSPDQISKHFTESDVFALPSFNEGFNIASLEAMSFGLVPILSKNAGVSEILENTLLARFIIDPGSIEQLNKCMNYLSDLDKADFHDLAKFSFELSKEFSFERFAEEFVRMMIHEVTE
jgi:glycosyltransferase involved in cell wall biosynthesis